ncbi:EAL domain-containing protein [Xanthomonas sp. AmX2]|uniref:EAL domain-containing protein n=1 Tax=Xanthomonas sp. TaxID=29446 RepID=UPI001981EFAF|nr:EAL domain-containing protein [Xanthomonas sp.]MBN6148762.1 EAL domain-containing protein [Xanthomonas sp.]
MLFKPTAIAPEEPLDATGSAPDRIVLALRGLLPAGSEVAIACCDDAIGRLCSASPGASARLRALAEDSLAVAAPPPPAPDTLLHLQDLPGGMRVAAVATVPRPLPAVERAAWCAAAAAFGGAILDAARLRARIEGLEKSKQLQQALYEIADLAGADLEMGQMLQRIHATLDTLMYAENCYIVECEEDRQSMRFLYFADQQDDFVADPQRRYRLHEMPNSLTFALLRHGRAVRGPSEQVRARLGVHYDPQRGPESKDWLGVPMLREGRVCGAIVVQNYDRAIRYTDADRALLAYVAQHVLTAMDRRHAQVRLERRVQQRTQELQLRTQELQRANHDLQEEIVERKRAETLQRALFRIAELAIRSESLQQFYAEVHAIVGGLIEARNLYIALLSDGGKMLEFAYSVDEYSPDRPARRLSNGLTEHVVRMRRPLLLDRAGIDQLVDSRQAQEFGAHAQSWLGVPLFDEGEVVGAIVVQSYSADVRFTEDDQRLLNFVAHNVGGGLARQRAQERLRLAHAELERRVAERTGELAEVNQQLLSQIAERWRAEQRLTHQALHDALTGLPNRAHLLDRLGEAIQRARDGDGMAFAVLFLDLDRFKLVNDSIGHAAGDQMLVEVAQRIVSTMRAGDVVARLGGDEFAMLVPCQDGLDGVRELAERVLAALGQPMWVAGRELFPSGSLGIAAWHPRYRSGEELLRDADAAMYRAKAQTQDRCAVFDEAMREAALRSLDLEADLRRAINNGDFQPFYQPIVRLADGQVVGHEALLRWRHESRGLLLPSQFIDLGEDSGLIEQVDWLLYAQVIRRLASDGGSGYVSVNVSPRHFRSPGFAERLFGLIEDAGADPHRLRVEITEVALLDDAPSTLSILEKLRDRGVLIQLDDFGTGFSALSYLHRFPISALKIDQSFVAGLHGDGGAGSQALVHGILALAGTLGIETIGEGIETERQLATLRELGCDYGQGYLLGRPAPRD